MNNFKAFVWIISLLSIHSNISLAQTISLQEEPMGLGGGAYKKTHSYTPITVCSKESISIDRTLIFHYNPGKRIGKSEEEFETSMTLMFGDSGTKKITIVYYVETVDKGGLVASYNKDFKVKIIEHSELGNFESVSLPHSFVNKEFKEEIRINPIDGKIELYLNGQNVITFQSAVWLDKSEALQISATCKSPLNFMKIQNARVTNDCNIKHIQQSTPEIILDTLKSLTIQIDTYKSDRFMLTENGLFLYIRSGSFSKNRIHIYNAMNLELIDEIIFTGDKPYCLMDFIFYHDSNLYIPIDDKVVMKYNSSRKKEIDVKKSNLHFLFCNTKTKECKTLSYKKIQKKFAPISHLILKENLECRNGAVNDQCVFKPDYNQSATLMIDTSREVQLIIEKPKVPKNGNSLHLVNGYNCLIDIHLTKQNKDLTKIAFIRDNYSFHQILDLANEINNTDYKRIIFSRVLSKTIPLEDILELGKRHSDLVPYLDSIAYGIAKETVDYNYYKTFHEKLNGQHSLPLLSSEISVIQKQLEKRNQIIYEKIESMPLWVKIHYVNSNNEASEYYNLISESLNKQMESVCGTWITGSNGRKIYISKLRTFVEHANIRKDVTVRWFDKMIRNGHCNMNSSIKYADSDLERLFLQFNWDAFINDDKDMQELRTSAIDFEWDGEYVNNAAHGNGRLMVTVNKQPYFLFEGNMIQGQMNQGKLMYDSGKGYEGKFRYGNFHGLGTFYYGKNEYISGDFMFSKPHGYVVQMDKYGDYREGYFCSKFISIKKSKIKPTTLLEQLDRNFETLSSIVFYFSEQMKIIFPVQTVNFESDCYTLQKVQNDLSCDGKDIGTSYALVRKSNDISIGQFFFNNIKDFCKRTLVTGIESIGWHFDQGILFPGYNYYRDGSIDDLKLVSRDRYIFKNHSPMDETARRLCGCVY